MLTSLGEKHAKFPLESMDTPRNEKETIVKKRMKGQNARVATVAQQGGYLGARLSLRKRVKLTNLESNYLRVGGGRNSSTATWNRRTLANHIDLRKRLGLSHRGVGKKKGGGNRFPTALALQNKRRKESESFARSFLLIRCWIAGPAPLKGRRTFELNTVGAYTR